MSEPSATDASWSSRFAFYLGTVGAAVGLGSIWRFPYLAGSSGGSAFVLVFVLAIAPHRDTAPRGRVHDRAPREMQPSQAAGEVARQSGLSERWNAIGLLGTAAAFLILSYYAVVAGWVLAYTWKCASGALSGLSARGGVGALAPFPLEPRGDGRLAPGLHRARGLLLGARPPWRHRARHQDPGTRAPRPAPPARRLRADGRREPARPCLRVRAELPRDHSRGRARRDRAGLLRHRSRHGDDACLRCLRLPWYVAGEVRRDHQRVDPSRLPPGDAPHIPPRLSLRDEPRSRSRARLRSPSEGLRRDARRARRGEFVLPPSRLRRPHAFDRGARARERVPPATDASPKGPYHAAVGGRRLAPGDRIRPLLQRLGALAPPGIPAGVRSEDLVRHRGLRGLERPSSARGRCSRASSSAGGWTAPSRRRSSPRRRPSPGVPASSSCAPCVRSRSWRCSSPSSSSRNDLLPRKAFNE